MSSKTDLFGADSSDEEDAAVITQSAPPSKKRELALDSDSDSDADEQKASKGKSVAVFGDDSSDDEDNAAAVQPKKKSKVDNVSKFIDDEADASSDEEEDEPTYTAAEIAAENMDEEARAIMREQDRRREQTAVFDGSRAVADVAEDIKNRYRGQGRVANKDSVIGGTDEIPEGHDSLMPSVDDPKMWMYKCIPGKEMELVIQIMNKARDFKNKGRVVGITGVSSGKTKGRLYVEGYSEPAVLHPLFTNVPPVLDFMHGIRMLMSYTMTLIPIGDMAAVMNVELKKKPVKEGQWLRMNRNPFKGDLCRVLEVRESGLKAIVQCMPRIDLALWNDDMSDAEKKIRRKTVKPPKKLYVQSEMNDRGVQTGTGRIPGFNQGGGVLQTFDGGFYKDGFFVKEVAVGVWVVPLTEETAPTLEELQDFRTKKADVDGDEKDEKEDQAMLDEMAELHQSLKKSTKAGSSNDATKNGLLLGDTVEVVEGDLIGMKGKIALITDTTVKINPINVDLDGMTEVEFLTSQVRKYIEVGVHVKITDGRFVDETGVVVAVEDVEGEKVVIILTDLTSKEVSVRASQVQESSDVSTGQETLQGYELYDLVALSGGGTTNEVGVITRVGREEFSVVNNHGASRDVRPEELRGKKNSTSQRAVALDFEGQQIRVGDSITVVAEGPHKNKPATIKHIHRAQLFLHTILKTDHAGIFVMRARSVSLADVSETRSQAPQGKASMGRANVRNEPEIGKTVKIIKPGPYKGYLGVIANSSADEFQVELHSKNKKVMVKKGEVRIVGDKYGNTDDQAARAVSQPRTGGGGFTPFLGSQTPLTGATPMHAGGLTPAHGGGATPMNSANYEDAEENVWLPGGALDQQSVASSTGPAQSWGDIGTTPQSTGWEDPQTGTPSDMDGTPMWSNQETPENIQDTPTSLTGSTGASFGSTPMSTGPQGGETEKFLVERAHVHLRGDGSTVYAIKTSVQDGITTVFNVETNEERNVAVADVERAVLPDASDRVLVVGGAEVGNEGALVCIDGMDAIFRDANGDFKIVDVADVVKITGE